MDIRTAAAQTGLSAHTIRYYERLGLLPPVDRTVGGSRQFSAADITFLQFVAGLKKTGMSLAEIAAFTADGCILERVQAGTMDPVGVGRRVAILQRHQEHLRAQAAELQRLLDAVDQKLMFYTTYLDRKG